jgi:hypothetical protein
MSQPLNRSTLALFFAKVEVDASGCWVWRAARNNDCYGQFYAESAHRTSYRWFVGAIPAGWQVDHLCRNTWCVNPAHLEAVTRSANVQRANAAKGFCKYGHPWTVENTRLWKNGGGKPIRMCAECNRRRSKAQFDKGRAVAAGAAR